MRFSQNRGFCLLATLFWCCIVAISARAADTVFIAPGRVPQLPTPSPYEPEGDTIVIELSQYAGYAGLIGEIDIVYMSRARSIIDFNWQNKLFRIY